MSLKGKVDKDGRLIVVLPEKLPVDSSVNVVVEMPSSESDHARLLDALDKTFGAIPDLNRPSQGEWRMADFD